MIQSRPKAQGKRMTVKSLFFLIAAITAIMFAPAFGRFGAASQLAGFIFAAYSLFILIKYVITDYLYTLEDSHLTVHRITKSQSICVADVDLGDIVKLYCCADEKNCVKKGKVFSFIKNPGSSDICVIIFSVAGSEYTLVFEPDTAFFDELKKEYQYIKNNNYNNEEEND